MPLGGFTLEHKHDLVSLRSRLLRQLGAGLDFAQGQEDRLGPLEEAGLVWADDLSHPPAKKSASSPVDEHEQHAAERDTDTDKGRWEVKIT